MTIRAVTFDADDTLWDFQTVAATAMDRVVERLIGTYPDLGPNVTVERLEQILRAIRADRPAGTPYPEMRRDSIRAFVTEVAGPDDRLSDQLGDLFFSIRDAEVAPFDDVESTLRTIREEFGEDMAVGVITNGNTTWSAMAIAHQFDFWLAADQIGVRKPDPRVFRMAAAAAGCRIRELVHVGDEPESDVLGAQRAGARAVFIDRRGIGQAGTTPDGVVSSLDQLPELIKRWDHEESSSVGVGPHPLPWPTGDRYDPHLLENGDRRNVEDRFRYWRRQAIVTELDRFRHPFHVAIENWHHDMNIGAVVRNANAFGAAAVHIVGERRWNRRGAMVTDRYQHVHHHPDFESLRRWAAPHDLPLIGIDNLPEATPIERASIPEACILIFGQERVGLSDRALPYLGDVFSISQFGSTRSINAGVASGIAMHAWIRQHADLPA